MKTKFPKDHPYMKRLDEVLSHYFVLKTIDPAVHGEDYEEMKEMILDKYPTIIEMYAIKRSI